MRIPFFLVDSLDGDTSFKVPKGRSHSKLVYGGCTYMREMEDSPPRYSCILPPSLFVFSQFVSVPPTGFFFSSSKDLIDY